MKLSIVGLSKSDLDLIVAKCFAAAEAMETDGAPPASNTSEYATYIALQRIVQVCSIMSAQAAALSPVPDPAALLSANGTGF